MNGDNIMVRGPLLEDDGVNSIGTIILLDVPDLDAGRALLEDEPFRKAGVYRELAYYRWRFGRVSDRFKP